MTAVVGLLLPFESKGILHETAFHRFTTRLMDVPNHELEILIKIYSSKAYFQANPAGFFDSEPISVHRADVISRFLPLLTDPDNTTLSDLFDEMLDFLMTIDPTAEGSYYPKCRFNYSLSTIA